MKEMAIQLPRSGSHAPLALQDLTISKPPTALLDNSLSISNAIVIQAAALMYPQADFATRFM